MAVKGIHHLGVAVGDLDAAVDAYRTLFGAHVEHRETVADQGVDACSLRVGDSRVELLSPLGADTPVGRFLASDGATEVNTFFGRTVMGANAVDGALCSLVILPDRRPG